MPSFRQLPMRAAPSAPSARKPAPASSHGPPTPRLQLEELETRDLLSASIVANPNLTLIPHASPHDVVGGYVVYSPAEVRGAYGFNQVPYNGAGQTIAIVNAYDSPNLINDLTTFDRAFGLPGQDAAGVASFLTRVNQYGGSTLPQANLNWGVEIALDVEWAHAIAPAAKILLVQANSSSGADLLTAVNTARRTAGVTVVSMSWGSSEFSSERYYDSFFTTPAGHVGSNGQPGGITFVASSGDSGAWYGSEWPAVSPNVLSVGGTSLGISGSSYAGESAWSGSGGGYSWYEARPDYQASANRIPVRATPDVAYDGNPRTGFYLYTTYAPGGASGWFQAGGTSAGAPQWAALLALANQGRAEAGLPSLYGAQSLLYALPRSDFHDVTTGNNGYAARVGYDPVTGLGSPYANLVINHLLSMQTANVGAGASANANGAAVVGRHDLETALDGSGGAPSAGVYTAAASMVAPWSGLGLAGVGPQQTPFTAYNLAPDEAWLTFTDHPAGFTPAASLLNNPLSDAPGAPTKDVWSDWQWYVLGSDLEASE